MSCLRTVVDLLPVTSSHPSFIVLRYYLFAKPAGDGDSETPQSASRTTGEHLHDHSGTGKVDTNSTHELLKRLLLLVHIFKATLQGQVIVLYSYIASSRDSGHKSDDIT